jgi:hypothetical protein
VKQLTKKQEGKIKAVIERMLKHLDIESCAIKVAEDATGDESIFIDLQYRPMAQAFDPAIMASLQSAVSAVLLADKDERFPHIRHHFSRGQKVKAA